jgi:3-carboxy-cis,cis-muconate cycloisomerase
VYDLCREAAQKNLPLIELLVVHPEIARHVDRAALEAMLDPANYLGQSGVMVDRVLARMPAAAMAIAARDSGASPATG